MLYLGAKKVMAGYSNRKPKHITTAFMFAALTLLTLYIADIIPVGRLAVLALCSFFVYAIMLESMYIGAFLCFAVVTFLGYLILPNKAGMVPYIALFGHYGIFRYLIGRVTGIGVSFILKLIYFNAGMAVIYFFGGGWLLQNIPWHFNTVMLVILTQAVYIGYEIVFGKLAQYYMEQGRVKLMGRTWADT